MSRLYSLVTALRSIYINFRCLPFNQAIHLPIIIGGSTYFENRLRKGSFVIDSVDINRGMISLGVDKGSFGGGDLQYIDIKNESQVCFHGRCHLARGFKLICGAQGHISFGNNVNINYNVLINANTSITIGDNVIMGWRCNLLDWDGHDIFTLPSYYVINAPKPISIGNNCWLGANCNILKGVSLEADIIIPVNTVINKSCPDSHVVYGGIPNRVLKDNVTWKI